MKHKKYCIEASAAPIFKFPWINRIIYYASDPYESLSIFMISTSFSTSVLLPERLAIFLQVSNTFYTLNLFLPFTSYFFLLFEWKTYPFWFVLFYCSWPLHPSPQTLAWIPGFVPHCGQCSYWCFFAGCHPLRPFLASYTRGSICKCKYCRLPRDRKARATRQLQTLSTKSISWKIESFILSAGQRDQMRWQEERKEWACWVWREDAWRGPNDRLRDRKGGVGARREGRTGGSWWKIMN